jgi:sigma-B regulation protein RsbU (phosphoserine phosphatase)
MKSSDSLKDLRHEIRSRLHHVAGYGEILKEDSRESAADIDLKPFFELLKSRCDLIRNELEVLKHISLTAARDKISRGVLDIYDASRDLLGTVAGNGKNYLKDDLEGLLASADSLLDYVKESFARLILPDTPAAAASRRRKNSVTGTRRPGRILIVDDSEMDRDILSRHLERQGHAVREASSGTAALDILARAETDLVLLDLMMPGFNGFQLLKTLKEDPALEEIPVIMLSAVEDPESIARCLELGAEDFISKTFDPILLKARVETTLEKKFLRDQERIYVEALLESRTKLLHELAEAALYVRHLLPEPMTEPIFVDWRYHPSAQLGGDSFGYHFLDESTLAFYLLDVSGHGIGASLLSVSVLNILRHHAVADADFREPASVLASLNRRFRMEDQNNMYFTLWYGVYDRSSRSLRYASAGSPPAVLVETDGTAELLSTGGTAVGIDEDAEYETREYDGPRGRLFLFSDGTYEIRKKGGGVLSVEDFYDFLVNSARDRSRGLDSIIAGLRALTPAGEFEDDLSLIEIRFP